MQRNSIYNDFNIMSSGSGNIAKGTFYCLIFWGVCWQ